MHTLSETLFEITDDILQDFLFVFGEMTTLLIPYAASEMKLSFAHQSGGFLVWIGLLLCWEMTMKNNE